MSGAETPAETPAENPAENPAEKPAGNRWLVETGGTRGPAYAEHFRKLAASGADLDGEARFVASLLRSPARVLEAGCGTGRVAVSLAQLGHTLTGVDLDASMLTEARRDALRVGADVRWLQADLIELPQVLPCEQFDLVVAAGNVLVYLTPGTEAAVVAAMAGALAPGGLLVSGFVLDRHVSSADYDRWCEQAGLLAAQRFSTWDRAPADAGGEPDTYAVRVHRR